MIKNNHKIYYKIYTINLYIDLYIYIYIYTYIIDYYWWWTEYTCILIATSAIAT